jgi:TonB dependent receptor
MKIQMKTNPLIICSVLILGVSTSLFAQDKKEGNIQNDDIILEKERKIVLQPQISRNFEPLNEIENTQKGRKMKYEFFDRKWDATSNTLLTTSIIGPREGDELVSSFGPKFKNLVKIGAGNFGHTLLNGHFGFTPKENQFQGVYINHDANRRGPVSMGNSSRNENEAKVYSKTFTGNYFLDGQISFKRTENNYYGRPEEAFTSVPFIKDLEIAYNKFNYSGSISNSKKDVKWDYIATSGLTYLTNNYTSKEWIWDSKLQGILRVTDNFSAYLTGEMNMSENTFAFVNNRRELYRVKPTFLYKNNRLAVTGGFNIVNEKDANLSLNKTRLFPMLKVDFKPTDFLHVFAGLGGETYFNSYNQYTSENNWVSPRLAPNLQNTTQSSNIYGGIKGSNERNLDFELKFGYSEYNNLAMFLNSTSDPSHFELIYANTQVEKSAKVFNMSGQVNYQTFDKVLSILKYDFNTYQDLVYDAADLSTIDKPIHRPMMNLSFTNSITFKDKIIVSPDLFYVSGLYSFEKSLTPKAEKMDDIIDLNLKVNYLITKKFNISVSANNLLGKNYQRYLNYISQGLNYTVGVAYSF